MLHHIERTRRSSQTRFGPLGAPSAEFALGQKELVRNSAKIDPTIKRRFGILLARNFTLSPLALFVDTLRLAGDDGDRSRRIDFDWDVIGEAGLPIRSSCGLQLMPSIGPREAQDYDVVVMIGGLLDRRPPIGSQAEQFLRRAARSGTPIAALCTGSFILAEYGLLDNYRACVSWFHIGEFRDRFPAVEASADALYIVDRDRATCAGGAGAADLAAHFVSSFLGEQKAEKAAKILLLDRVRNHRDVQPAGGIFANARSVAVRRALLIMESNLQRPLTIARLANAVDCSPRQLERRFMAEIGLPPGKAYMRLRIDRAAKLIRTTELPIAQIGYDLGFVNAGHFSRVFRKYTGILATEVRRHKFIV